MAERRAFKHVEYRLSGGVVPVTTVADSARMAEIRRQGTEAERTVRRAAWEMGLRVHAPRQRLPGSPDLVHLGFRLAVFVHGCFWHGHLGCHRATVPKRNREFWLAKFRRNRERDRAVSRQLRRLGFRVLTIWECETEYPARLSAKLRPVARAGRRRVSPSSSTV